MSLPPSPDFDRFAERYEADLRESMPGALAEDRYFAEYKVLHVARRLGEFAKRGTPPRLLDYGCGIGRSLGLFGAHLPGAELWGYDPSPRSIELARERAPGARLTSTAGELPAATFDAVFAANVFHHIPPAGRGDAMAQCAALLRESGRVFLFEHNPLNPVTRRVFERCPYDEGARMLGRGEVHRLAAAAGLRVLRSGYTLFFPRPLAFLRPVEPWLRWLPLGAQYCVEMGR